MTQNPATSTSFKSTVVVAMAAIGIVFGDLGTSPLYALQAAFEGSAAVLPNVANVTGIVSLFLWSLILMVSLKYVFVLMRADNRGEGGILALMALLVGNSTTGKSKKKTIWILLALVGMAMLYGDGVITPAISVLSAIEGVEVATPAFHPYIVPLTIVILIGLFAIQPYGSGKVGVAFGPILLVWFIVIGAMGIVSIFETPAILKAFNPIYGAIFFKENGGKGFIALGAVVLCLTGGEALYADMGHFGRKPIRLAWYAVALPALALNYLGQGALLLRQPAAASRPFYTLVPDWGLYPMVILATLATIVAAQALITAVFSLTSQASHLGLSPRVKTVHTSDSTAGQIYLPGLNWVLMLGTIAVVLMFPSSAQLAAAFGLAVSTTMAITTVLFAALAKSRWKWSNWKIAAVAGVFFTIDLAFVGANSLKFMEGGWLSVLIGTGVLLITYSWFKGSSVLYSLRDNSGINLESLVASLAISPPYQVKGTAVFLTEQVVNVPTVLFHHLKHNQVLHEKTIILTLKTDETPRVDDNERLVINELQLGFIRIVARHGYMEEPNVPRMLELAELKTGHHFFDEMTTSFYLGHETLVINEGSGNLLRRLILNIFIWFRKNENDATSRYHIPPNRVVEMGARLELSEAR